MKKVSLVSGLVLFLVFGFGPFLTGSYGDMGVLDGGSVFPGIKANGSVGSITVPSGTPVVVSISLDPATREGELADWWVLCYGPGSITLPGWNAYAHPTGWLQGIEVAVQVGLFPFESFIVFNRALPPGEYTFYFALNDPNGQIDGSFWGIDSVSVIVGEDSAAPVVPKTGQTTSYGTRDDGALRQGVAWPNPRFTDNNNGTVKDNLTGLIWLKNANCFGTRNWTTALAAANGLADGACGLTDGSSAGDWNLPNRFQLESLLDLSRSNPALPAGHPFTGVQSYGGWWSSTTYANFTSYAWYVHLRGGGFISDAKCDAFFVWPVRAGQ